MRFFWVCTDVDRRRQRYISLSGNIFKIMFNPSRSGELAANGRFVDDYLAALLAQASHLISSEFHEVARSHGLSVSEWRVLATLAGNEPISIGRLAQVAVLKQPTVTRMLDRMEAKDQVERLAHDGDRRVTLVRITANGSRMVARLIALARDHEAKVLEPFGLAHAEDLKATLRRIIELHRDPTAEA
jgi:DNA-binding MarR family transcriptional regulator